MILKMLKKLLLVMLFTGLVPLWAQCPKDAQELMGQNFPFTGSIERLMYQMQEFEGDLSLSSIDPKYLIVPGQKAGLFELGSAQKTIEKLIPLGEKKLQSAHQRRQNYFKALKKKRVFFESYANQIEFAFDARNLELTEIFVQNEAYMTRKGISVGDSASSVKDFYEIKEHSKDGYVFMEGESITFVSGQGIIVEIIVHPSAESNS